MPRHADDPASQNGEEEMIATQTFTCNICGEESSRICARCTKDTCNNHLCEKCLRCSDCCECEVVRDESVRPVVRPPAREPAPEPSPVEAPPEVAVEGAPVLPEPEPQPECEVVMETLSEEAIGETPQATEPDNVGQPERPATGVSDLPSEP
jgi:hypothetical protein